MPVSSAEFLAVTNSHCVNNPLKSEGNVKLQTGILNQLISILVVLTLTTSLLGLPGCKAGPEVSTLESVEIAPPGTKIAVLPKGDVYEDEEVLRSDLRISPGDTIEVLINQEDGVETVTSVVSEKGVIALGFLKPRVLGLTASQVEARLQKELDPYYIHATVQVQIKMKKVRVKRVFIFGDVKNAGMIPMSRSKIGRAHV